MLDVKITTVIIISIVLLSGFIITQAGEDDLTVTLEELQRFGSEDDAEGLIGRVTSLAVDNEQNLYVLDMSFQVVKLFSRDGKYVRSYGMGKGNGPGEFQAPNCVSIDNSGNIYVSDQTSRNISVFDKSNKFIRSIKVPFMPAQIIAIDNMVIDATGYPFTYKGEIVQRYNLGGENADKPIKVYCERLSGMESKLFEMSGNMGRLVLGNNNDIYYSLSYPYEIRRFTLEGELLNTIVSDRTLTPPKKESSGMISSDNIAKDIVLLPDDILLVLYQNRNGEEIEQTFDFFNGISGVFLGSISCKELGLNYIRKLQSDMEGNLYVDVSEPFPQVVKYKLVIE